MCGPHIDCISFTSSHTWSLLDLEQWNWYTTLRIPFPLPCPPQNLLEPDPQPERKRSSSADLFVPSTAVADLRVQLTHCFDCTELRLDVFIEISIISIWSCSWEVIVSQNPNPLFFLLFFSPTVIRPTSKRSQSIQGFSKLFPTL